MRPRIEHELALLRQHYGAVEHSEVAGDDWFRLPATPCRLAGKSARPL